MLILDQNCFEQSSQIQYRRGWRSPQRSFCTNLHLTRQQFCLQLALLWINCLLIGVSLHTNTLLQFWYDLNTYMERYSCNYLGNSIDLWYTSSKFHHLQNIKILRPARLLKTTVIGKLGCTCESALNSNMFHVL